MFTPTWRRPDHIFIVDYPDRVDTKFVMASRSTVATKQGDTDTANLFAIHVYLVCRHFPRICANKIIKRDLEMRSTNISHSLLLEQKDNNLHISLPNYCHGAGSTTGAATSRSKSVRPSAYSQNTNCVFEDPLLRVLEARDTCALTRRP